MGNKVCQKICADVQNQQAQYFINKSPYDWVRRMNVSKYEKQIVSAKTNDNPQKNYCIIHDSDDYRRGVIFSGSSFYQGQLNDQMGCGKGTEYTLTMGRNNKQIQCMYSGQFQNNCKNGRGVYKDNEIRFEGKWKDGYPIQGVLTQNDDNTRKYHIRKLHFNTADMQTGIVVIEFPDGSEYDGQIVKNEKNKFVLEGAGILNMKNRDSYKGTFKNGKFSGQGTYQQFKTGHKYVGDYLNGMKHGFGKLYVAYNVYLSGKWVKGKKQQQFTMYKQDDDGNKIDIGESIFQNDKLVSK